jgi:hypothetical protein
MGEYPALSDDDIEVIARQLKGRMPSNIFLRHVTITTDDFETVSST